MEKDRIIFCPGRKGPVVKEAYCEDQTCSSCTKKHDRIGERLTRPRRSPSLVLRPRREKEQPLLPEDNVRTWIHVYGLINEIESVPLRPIKNSFDDFRLRNNNLSRAEAARAFKSIQSDNDLDILQDSFYEARKFMSNPPRILRMHYPDMSLPEGHHRERTTSRGPKVQSWSFNTLLMVLDADIRHYTKRGGNAQLLSILQNKHIEAAGHHNAEWIRDRIRYLNTDLIHELIKILYDACMETGRPFFPQGVAIPDFPIDFRVVLASDLGHKRNKYVGYFDESDPLVFIKEYIPDYLAFQYYKTGDNSRRSD
jgi:hypothetical protein